MFQKSAWDLWLRDSKTLPIITLCKSLDKSLDGGIPPRIITDFCGGPGTGKTQMCLQLCVNVQFPLEFGGIGGKALYIDTNQGFNPYRLQDMAKHCVERYRETYKKIYKTQNVPTDFSSESVLNNVSYIYCKDYVELLATVENVKKIVSEDEDIMLVVVDSFTFLFRNMYNYTERTRIVYEILTDLQELADKHEFAVVTTSEVTTIFNKKQPIVMPALGESLAHKVGQRIMLDKHEDHYVAFLAKCFNSEKKFIPFKITEKGIRD